MCWLLLWFFPGRLWYHAMGLSVPSFSTRWDKKNGYRYIFFISQDISCQNLCFEYDSKLIKEITSYI